MFAFLISAIEWAKLIIGCALLVMGSLVMLNQFRNWVVLSLLGGKTIALGWLVQGGTTIMGLIILITGFYIAGW